MINHSCYCIGPNIRQYFVRGGCITFKDHTLRFSQKHVNEARTGKKGIKLHLIFVSFYDTIRWPYYLDHNIFKTKCYCSLLSFLDSVNREPQEAPSTDWCHQIASNNPLLFSVTTSIQESTVPNPSSFLRNTCDNMKYHHIWLRSVFDLCSVKSMNEFVQAESICFADGTVKISNSTEFHHGLLELTL